MGCSVLVCVCVLVAQLNLTLYDPMDCSSPVSSVHGVLQQEYWSGLPFPSPGGLPDPLGQGLNPGLLHCRHLPSEPLGKQLCVLVWSANPELESFVFFCKFTSSVFLVCGTPTFQGYRKVTLHTSSKSCTCLIYMILSHWKCPVGISRNHLAKHMDLELKRIRNCPHANGYWTKPSFQPTSCLKFSLPSSLTRDSHREGEVEIEWAMTV